MTILLALPIIILAYRIGHRRGLAQGFHALQVAGAIWKDGVRG